MDNFLEIEYAAGFLDGEGSVVLRTEQPLPYVNLAAGQGRREPLERVQALFGGRIYQSLTETNKVQYEWYLGRAPLVFKCIQCILPKVTHPGFKRQLRLALELARLTGRSGRVASEKEQVLRWRLADLLLQEKENGK